MVRKKQKEKFSYIGIETENGIREILANRYRATRILFRAIWFLATLMIILIAGLTVKNETLVLLIGLPLLAIAVVPVAITWREGNKFAKHVWNKIKNQEQPIDLREYFGGGK